MPDSRGFVPRTRLVVLLVLLMMLLGAGLVWYGLASPSTSAPGATQVALSYGRSEMQWFSGPTVQNTYTIPLRQLHATLERSVQPPNVVTDVNVPGLIRQYGPNHRIVLVVLYGVYNSLPPDEGAEVRGDAVVLVDARTSHVLLLED